MERDCWIWPGRHDAKGRPKARHTLVYRLIFELWRGRIPAGRQVHHVCHNPGCVNPRHIVLVTADEHLSLHARRTVHANARKTHCKHGHEFTPENTYRRTTGGRSCKACLELRRRPENLPQTDSLRRGPRAGRRPTREQ